MKSSYTLALIGMSIATFLGWLDFTMVNTAFPAMQTSFGINDSTLKLILNALLLSLFAFMVIVGELPDRFGHRQLNILSKNYKL